MKTTRPQTLLLVDDDENIVRGLAAVLERPGRSIVTCTDVESTRLVLEKCPVSAVVSDIQLSGPFGYEGLDLVREAVRKVPSCRVVLMTGHATNDLRREARARGAVALLQKPLDGAAIEELLGGEGDDSLANVVHVPSLDDILTGDRIRSHYQPLHRLAGDVPQLFAAEALARLQDDSILRNPEVLFRYAASKRRQLDLDLLCLQRGIADFPTLGREITLFLNVHPTSLGTGRVAETVLDACTRSGVDPNQLVLEITEQSSISVVEPALVEIRRLQAAGVRFAFDDLGVAYSHLPLIEQIRPAFFKVSQELGFDCEAVPTKTKIVRNIMALAADFDCEVILEGVESAATLDFARRIGIQYAQGYYLGRPAPAIDWERLTQRAS